VEVPVNGALTVSICDLGLKEGSRAAARCTNLGEEGEGGGVAEGKMAAGGGGGCTFLMILWRNCACLWHRFAARAAA